MTAPAESAPPPSGGWKTLLPLVAPALVFLAIVVQFLRFHEYALLLPESLALMAAAALSGLAIGALGRLRSETLAPLLMAVALSVYLYFRQEVTDYLVRVVEAVEVWTGHPVVVFVVLGTAIFAALSVACVLLKQHVDAIVAAAFGMMVVSTLVLPVGAGGAPTQAGTLPDDLKDLPPVIHIILDEHIGPAGIPPEAEKRDEARELLTATYRDFALYDHAYSRFAETKYSLTSLMNGDVGADVGDILRGELFVFEPKTNDWFNRLKGKGYALKVYQSAWFDMCNGFRSVDACYTYSFFSPNAIQRTPLTASQKFRALALRLFKGSGALQLEPLVSMHALEQFRDDLARTPKGVAYIVHLLIPHFGYLYTDDCSLLDPSKWERDGFGEDQVYTPEERRALYRRYLDQLICANRQMQSLFADLKQLDVYDEATIIIHGDHGSRIAETPYITEMPGTLTTQDMIDHYSTLLAIKAPGIAAGIRDEPVALQRVFAEAFLGGGRSPAPQQGEVFVRIDEEDGFSPLAFSWPGRPGSDSSVVGDARAIRGVVRELRR